MGMGHDAIPAFLLILLFAGIIGLIIFLAYWSWKKEQERIAALEQLASGLGLSFSRAKDYGIPDRYRHLNGFNHGHSRHAYNVMSGVYREYRLMAFDFHYAVTRTYSDSKGRTRTRTEHHYFTSVVVDLPVRIPAELFIRAEGMLDRLAGFVGFDDIDFESDEFSRTFHVKCTDRKFAYDVIHARMMEFLMPRNFYQIEMERQQLHLRTNGKMNPAQWKQALSDAVDFLELTPKYVVQQLEGRG